MFRKVIKDTIHNYIGITEPELKILDSPYFQRLRYIKQNSMTYLTYPSASHTRFEHSLGTMHLAGLMYDGALSSLNEDQIRKLLNGLDPKIAWQAVRISAMLHDIGHPPFSHIFEDFLDESLRRAEVELYKNSTLSPAEYATLQIMEKHLVPISNDYLNLVSQIFHPAAKEGGLPLESAKILHSIISSQLDADRLDYILRDAYTSGFQIANPDVDRIVNNLNIINNGIYISDRAISSVETVIVERLKLYKYVYFHHKVKSSNECLRRIMMYMMSSSESILNYDDFHYSKYVMEDKASYFDDAFILSVLSEFYSKNLKDPLFHEMKDCLRRLIFRDNLPIELWKTDVDYIAFSKYVVDAVKRKKEALRSEAKRKGSDPNLVDQILNDLERGTTDILGNLDDFYPENLEEKISEQIKLSCERDPELAGYEEPLYSSGVWLARGGTRVYDPLAQDIVVVTPQGRTLPLSNASKIVSSIVDSADPFELNIILVPRRESYEAVKERCSNIRTALADRITDLVVETIHSKLGRG